MEEINEKVSVYSWYDRTSNKAVIVWVRWQGKDYRTIYQDYYKRHRNGQVIFHEYYVATDTLTFHLIFDPDTMHWMLKDTLDGRTNKS